MPRGLGRPRHGGRSLWTEILALRPEPRRSLGSALVGVLARLARRAPADAQVDEREEQLVERLVDVGRARCEALKIVRAWAPAAQLVAIDGIYARADAKIRVRTSIVVSIHPKNTDRR